MADSVVDCIVVVVLIVVTVLEVDFMVVVRGSERSFCIFITISPRQHSKKGKHEYICSDDIPSRNVHYTINFPFLDPGVSIRNEFTIYNTAVTSSQNLNESIRNKRIARLS